MKKIAVLVTIFSCFFASTVSTQPVENDVTAYKEAVQKKEA